MPGVSRRASRQCDSFLVFVLGTDVVSRLDLPAPPQSRAVLEAASQAHQMVRIHPDVGRELCDAVAGFPGLKTSRGDHVDLLQTPGPFSKEGGANQCGDQGGPRCVEGRSLDFDFDFE
jgi:hypothetical protein